MENQNANVNKRYNRFRQARRKKDKSNTINVDEVSGRHYKLERFLRDCILHLPKHKQECENDLASDLANTDVVTKPKTSRPKHVKLPVLNECKGLFENVVIGRSAKKGGEFGEIAATPEDRARLHEDIHALAKVGPDSELSFELFPHSPLQNQPLDDVQHNHETQERPVSPPERMTDISSMNAPGGSFQEEYNRSGRTRCSRSPNEWEPNVEAGSHQDISLEHRPNSLTTDSGFKDAAGSHMGETPPRPPSFHCDCCQKSKSHQNFFNADAILKSNEAPDPRSLRAPSFVVPSFEAPSFVVPSFPTPSFGVLSQENLSVRSGMNEIFSNQRDTIRLFEDASGGPGNSLRSTYQPWSEPPFDFAGIEIQSSAPEHLWDEGRSVYTERTREPPPSPRMLRRKIPWPGFNKGMDVKRHCMHRDPLLLQSDSVCLPHLSPYNRFRYNRSLSPRKY